MTTLTRMRRAALLAWSVSLGAMALGSHAVAQADVGQTELGQIELAQAAPPPVSPSSDSEASEPAERERAIGIDEFRRIADGKTLYFELEDGTPWGKEYYLPGTQESVFVFHDGECFEGYWTYDGLHYCYHYQAAPSCWEHFWENGRLTVESRGGNRQVVGAIKDREPLSCQPELLSRAPTEALRLAQSLLAGPRP